MSHLDDPGSDLPPPSPPAPPLPAPLPPAPALPPAPGAPVQAGAVATWRGFEAIPVFLIAFIATTAASIWAVALFHSEGARLTMVSAVFELGLALGVILWIRALHRAAMPALGLPARVGRELLVGAVGGVLIRVVAFAAALLVVMLTEIVTDRAPSVPEQVPSELSGLAQFLLGAVVVIGAPLGEELFFRGFLFRGLRARQGFWIAALISSVAFAVVHVVEGNWFLVPVMFAVGMCLAYVYEREGRILVPIAAHAMFNLIGMAFIVWG